MKLTREEYDRLKADLETLYVAQCRTVGAVGRVRQFAERALATAEFEVPKEPGQVAFEAFYPDDTWSALNLKYQSEWAAVEVAVLAAHEKEAGRG